MLSLSKKKKPTWEYILEFLNFFLEFVNIFFDVNLHRQGMESGASRGLFSKVLILTSWRIEKPSLRPRREKPNI